MTSSIIHSKLVAPTPQAVCSHHKQPIALKERRYHLPHLTEMKSGPLPPATDWTIGANNAKLDVGSTQPTATSVSMLASDVDVQQASLCVVINQPVGNPKRKV
jgi:hypothetical protein